MKHFYHADLLVLTFEPPEVEEDMLCLYCNKRAAEEYGLFCKRCAVKFKREIDEFNNAMALADNKWTHGE